MRTTAFSILVSMACLAGCMSNSAIDALQLAPSQETTSSIVRPDADISQAGMTALAEPDVQATPALEQVAMLMPGASAAGKIHPARFSDAKPINFGPVKPDHHAVHGVDVSRWQGEIDWKRLRAQGANFAFIKATDGADHVDPMFKKNWDGAHKAGIRRGAYHFFYWCSFASAQADWFIRNVPKVPGALPPVLDVEWNHQSNCRQRLSPQKAREKMQVFLDRLEQHYGQRPIIYTAPDFYRDNLKDAFPNHPFWLRAVAQHPSKVYPGRDWVFWQYSGSGLSKGVEGKIDLNVFHGDEKAWWRWVGQVAG
jgi:lysozyme